MLIKKLQSPAVLSRIATVIVGIVVVGLGTYSHYKSSWFKSHALVVPRGYIKYYKICVYDFFPKCPGITFENFFIVTIIFCFVLSVCDLLGSILVNTKSLLLKRIQIVFHALAAILLLIAGALYIVSTEQINDIVKEFDGKYSLYFRRSEKLAAGALAIVLGILYAVATVFIVKQPVNKDT